MDDIKDIREARNRVEFKETNERGDNHSAVDWCEKEYPEMTTEYKRIMWEQYETFCKKNKNYGTGNISVGSDLKTEDDRRLALTGLWFRKSDKINRLKQLVVLGHTDEVGESIQDTYADLSVYGIISQIVANGKWGK